MNALLEHPAATGPSVERAEIGRLLSAGQHDRAYDLARRAVQNMPDDAWTWNALGMALRGAGKAEAAVAAYARSLALRPGQPAVFSNCGNALKALHRFDEAIAFHRRAVAADPKSSLFAANLGVALREAGMIEEALAVTERAVSLDPDSASIRFDRAQLRLALGDFTGGWDDFEARWRLPEITTPKFRQPLWDGKALPGGTILLWPEQGFGDTILCARFARLVKQRVGRVVLAVKPELMRLLKDVEGVDAVVPYTGAPPAFDVHCPLMRLPRFFVSDLTQIPAPARLHVPAESRAKLAPVLAQAGARLRIGIVWSGSITFKSNHLRATEIERFLRLAELPGVQLFSLQKGPRAGELAKAGAAPLFIDLAPLLDDFADTAAAVAGLDLVIMTDSSVAHLAGSLGTPIWNLLPKVAYWLYLRDRMDTPWYPSMRLFRQPRHDDWDSVFDAVVRELSEIARGRQRAGQAPSAQSA